MAKQGRKSGTRRKAVKETREAAKAPAGATGTTSGGLARPGPSSPSAVQNPFALMRRFADEMDRFFDFGSGFGRFPRFDPPGHGWDAVAWSPSVDVTEQGGKLLIRADLPGLSRKDVTVELRDDAVCIRGERRHEKESRGKGFFHSERRYGSFYREIPLPEGIDPEKATATFRNGVLEVSLPAPPRPARGRQVAVEE
jgi:HSP20 family protein